MAPTATATAPDSAAISAKGRNMDSSGRYVRWDQPGVEHGAGPEEEHVINEVARQINTAQQAVLDAHHHAFSGTHVKSHGVVKGTMEASSQKPTPRSTKNFPDEMAQADMSNKPPF